MRLLIKILKAKSVSPTRPAICPILVSAKGTLLNRESDGSIRNQRMMGIAESVEAIVQNIRQCYNTFMGIGDAFGKLGDINKLRQQAMQMQKSLSGQQIVLEESGVKVVITGDQKILELEIQGLSNQVLNDVLNKAIRKSQELAAKELMNISGGQS